MNPTELFNASKISPAERAPTSPSFTQSNFSGGQMQIGAPSQQIGKTDEEAMYDNLAVISTGVQQGLDNYRIIGSQIDKETIDEVEAQWNRIDALDINPYQKVDMFNPILEKTKTPMLGTTWRTNIAAQISKSWGPKAYEGFAKEQYEKQAIGWAGYDGIMGPEQVVQFVEEFKKKNPALAGSLFVQGVEKQAEAGVRFTTQERLLNVLVLGKSMPYSIDTATREGLANGSISPAQFIEMNPVAGKAISLVLDNTTINFDSFYEYMKNDFSIERELENLDPNIRVKAMQLIDTAAHNAAQKTWEIAQALRVIQVKQDAEMGSQVSISTYISNPSLINRQALAEAAKQRLSVSSPPEQMAYINSLISIFIEAKMKDGSGYSFASLIEQKKVLKEELTAVLDDGAIDTMKPKVNGRSEMKVSSPIDDFVTRGLRAFEIDTVVEKSLDVFYNSKQGIEFTAGFQKLMDSTAVGISNMVKTGAIASASEALDIFVRDFAEYSGLTDDKIRSIFMEKVTVLRDGAPADSKLPSDMIEIWQLKESQIVDALKDPTTRALLAGIGLADPIALNHIWNQIETVVGSMPQKAPGTKQKVQKYATENQVYLALNDEPGLYKAAIDELNSGDYEEGSPHYLDLKMIAQTGGSFAATVLLSTEAAIDFKLLEGESQYSKDLIKRVRENPKVALSEEEKKYVETFQKDKDVYFEYVYGITQKEFLELDFWDPTYPRTIQGVINKTYKEGFTSTTNSYFGATTPEANLTLLILEGHAKSISIAGPSPERTAMVSSLTDSIMTLASQDGEVDIPRFYTVVHIMRGLGDFQFGLESNNSGTFNQETQVRTDSMIGLANLLSKLPNGIPKNIGTMSEEAKTFFMYVRLGFESIAINASATVVPPLLGMGPRYGSPQQVSRHIVSSFQGNAAFAEAPLFGASQEAKNQHENSTLQTNGKAFVKLVEDGLMFSSYESPHYPREDGSPALTAKQKDLILLDNWREFLLPIIGYKGNSLFFSSSLPLPEDNSGLTIKVGKKGHKKWVDMTVDEKIWYYGSVAAELNPEKLTHMLHTALSATYLISSAANDTSKEERTELLQFYIPASQTAHRSSTFGNNSSTSYALRWIPTAKGLLDHTYAGFELIQIGNQPECSSYKTNDLVYNATTSIFPNGQAPDFSALETLAGETDSNRTTKGQEDRVEAVGDMMGEKDENDEIIAKGVFNSIKPAQAFLMGKMGQSVSFTTVNDLLDILGIENPSHSGRIDLPTMDKLLFDSEIARYGKSPPLTVLEFIQNSPFAGELDTVLQEINLGGRGGLKSVKFELNADESTLYLVIPNQSNESERLSRPLKLSTYVTMGTPSEQAQRFIFLMEQIKLIDNRAYTARLKREKLKPQTTDKPDTRGLVRPTSDTPPKIEED